MNRPICLPIVLGIPAVLLGLAILLRGPIENALGISASGGGETAYPIVYPYWNKLPHWLIISFFTFFSVLALVAIVAEVVRFWRGMKAADARSGNAAPAKPLGSAIASALKTVVGHNDFDVCTTERTRFLSHYCVFYGFIALVAVALWVIFLAVTAPLGNPLLARDFVYPFHFFNPWRMLANLGGLAVLAGGGLMIWERLKGRERIGIGTYFDWAFLAAVLLVVVTGFLSEILHYLRMEPHRQIVYFSHLVFVFVLLMYLPYSKFAHMLYRTTAMVYAEYSGRTRPAAAAVDTTAAQQPPQPEASNE